MAAASMASETLSVVAGRGYFKSEQILACRLIAACVNSEKLERGTNKLAATTELVSLARRWRSISRLGSFIGGLCFDPYRSVVGAGIGR